MKMSQLLQVAFRVAASDVDEGASLAQRLDVESLNKALALQARATP